MTGSVTYAVPGMVCGHCADLITEEVSRITGVTGVSVAVEAGTVTVTSERPLPLTEVRAAVEEAGYEIRDP
ncbi:heavy-metal-associated domain-containing protein [Streptomyces uncialis]|uniref:heavy-metal-associated domain-containing protein n=1 Tax=Streptomyces uncialis TaxID=1048205 RepID=UPI0033E62022